MFAINCGQNVGIFSREVRFSHDEDSSGNCSGGSKATVKVSWADNKCPVGNPLCHSVELITCFSSIDLKPTP
ncbi:MAG: hypothetical protein US55_C0038G0001 [Candidatus Levybacteria bacterium GW2011_GWC2_37_7]|nr:MAG: hypothetical protein US55_C0038G0001 [Candidatus Levybacteria bacterium GW2011_GWC2_37_7]